MLGMGSESEIKQISVIQLSNAKEQSDFALNLVGVGEVDQPSLSVVLQQSLKSVA